LCWALYLSGNATQTGEVALSQPARFEYRK